MSLLVHVVIVMSRCSRTREGFGIRFEEKGRGQWLADWAFPVKERLAKKEGYDRAEIKGSIRLDDEYPGCPYCKNTSVVYCPECGKVSCYDIRAGVSTCGWCGSRGQVGGGGVTNLTGGDDL